MNPSTELTNFLESSNSADIWRKWESIREKYTKNQDLGLDYFLCLLSNDRIKSLWKDFPYEDKESFKAFCRDKQTDKSSLINFYQYIRNPENPWFAIKANSNIVSYLEEVITKSESNSTFLHQTPESLFLWLVGGIKYYRAPKGTSSQDNKSLSNAVLSSQLFINIIFDNYGYFKERAMQRKNFELKYLIREFNLNAVIDDGIKIQCYNEESAAYIFESDKNDCEQKLRYLVVPNYLDSFFPEVPFQDLDQFKAFFRKKATKEFSTKFLNDIQTNAKYWLFKKASQPIQSYIEELLTHEDDFELSSRHLLHHSLCHLLGLKAYEPINSNQEIALQLVAPSLDYINSASLFTEIFILNRSFFQNLDNPKIKKELYFLINELDLFKKISFQDIKKYEELLFSDNPAISREALKSIFEEEYLSRLFPDVPFIEITQFKNYCENEIDEQLFNECFLQENSKFFVWKNFKVNKEIKEYIELNQNQLGIQYIAGLRRYRPSFLSKETLTLLEFGEKSGNLLINVFRDGFEYFEDQFKKNNFLEVDWLISSCGLNRVYIKNDSNSFKIFFNSLLIETQKSADKKLTISDCIHICYDWNGDVNIVEVDAKEKVNISLGKVNMMKVNPQAECSEISSLDFSFKVENKENRDPLESGFLFFEPDHHIILTPDSEEYVTKEYSFGLSGIVNSTSAVRVKVSYQPVFLDILEKNIPLPKVKVQSDLDRMQEIQIPIRVQNIDNLNDHIIGIETIGLLKDSINKINIVSCAPNIHKNQVDLKIQFKFNESFFQDLNKNYEIFYQLNSNLGIVQGVLFLILVLPAITVTKKKNGVYSIVSNTKHRVEDLTFTLAGKTKRINGFTGIIDLKLGKKFNADLSIQSGTNTFYLERNIFNDDIEQKDRTHISIFSKLLIYYFRSIHTVFWLITYFIYTSMHRRYSSNGAFYHYYIWLIGLEGFILLTIFQVRDIISSLPEKIYSLFAYKRLSLLTDRLLQSKKNAMKDFAFFSVILYLHLFFSFISYSYSRILTKFHVPYADSEVSANANGFFRYSINILFNKSDDHKFYSGDLGDIVLEFSLFMGVIVFFFYTTKIFGKIISRIILKKNNSKNPKNVQKS